MPTTAPLGSASGSASQVVLDANRWAPQTVAAVLSRPHASNNRQKWEVRRGGKMFRGFFGYVDLGVLGLIAFLALIALVSGFTDLMRYMKIRSM